MSNLARVSIWLTLSELAFNLSSYVVHSFLGRLLEPAGYGQFSLIITFTTMIIILIGRGIPIAMSKHLSELIGQHRENEIPALKRNTAFIQFILVAAVTIAYFFLAPVFAKLLRDESLTDLFRISSLIIPTFALASFYIYYYNGIQHFGKQSALKFVRSLAKVAVIIGLGYYFKTVGAIIGQGLAPLSVFFTAILLDPYRKVKSSFMQSLSKDTMKKLLSFAWPIILFMVAYEIMISIDLYMVKALMQSDYWTGIYNSALTVGRIPYYAFYFLTIILLPKVSEVVSQGNKEKTNKLLRNAFRFLFMYLTPVVAILALFSQSAIRFFYGSKFTEATGAMNVLVFGLGFLTVFYILTFVLNGAGKNKFPMYLSFFGLVMNAILNYILIRKLGILGAAWATTITSFTVSVIALVYANLKITNFIEILSLAKYIFASALVYYLGSMIFGQGRFIFILWSVILLAIYILILFIIKEFKKEDAHSFITIFSNKIIKK